MDMYLWLYLLANHAYFDLGDFFAEILPRAQRKEDLVISVHIPTSLDSVSVSDYCIGTFLK